MSEFYIELKHLREEQKIDLEEIHSRTKINLEYLESIEKGQFDILPIPYVRLFLRAYVTEIGGDSEEALHQLEILLARKEGRNLPKKPVDDIHSESLQREKKPSPKPSLARSSDKVRQDLIKGGILLIVFLFAIFIIKKINNEDSIAVINDGNVILADNPNAISNNQLINDYVEAVSQTDGLNVDPPFILKITATERIWYRVEADTATQQEGILIPGNERSISFENKIHVRLNQSIGTLVYINGKNIEKLGEFSHPAEIIFLASPKTVTVKHYLPQR